MRTPHMILLLGAALLWAAAHAHAAGAARPGQAGTNPYGPAAQAGSGT